jgi:nucleotide-binding universal stress UspA family protein
MKRVLIPVDGSPCSLRAVELIIAKRARYANPDDLDIHLVHVEPQLNADVKRFVSQEHLADYRQEQTDKAIGAARRLLEAAGARHTCHGGVGPVAEVVARLADQLGCDQITMGTHGRGALADLLLGSNTLKVIHLARVPVLLVK